VPIPGSRRRVHLEENIAAVNVELTERDLADLDAAMPPDAAAGLRYPEAMMRAINL
jgi:diketogulonate reductase-like aldo/keto reductase